MSGPRRRIRLQIIAVGKAKPPFHAAIVEYENRVDRRWGLRTDEVSPAPLQRGEERARADEAQRIRALVIPGSYRVALDPEGKDPGTSTRFAAWMGKRIESGAALTFIIGGASGIDAALRDECEACISLGTLTMPHQLARLVLTEQLYRAQCILDGHPYPH